MRFSIATDHLTTIESPAVAEGNTACNPVGRHSNQWCVSFLDSLQRKFGVKIATLTHKGSLDNKR